MEGGDRDFEPRTIADCSSKETVTANLAEAVCDYKGVDPLEAEFSLYDYVDTEALDTLVDSVSKGLEIRFTIEDVAVCLWKSGSDTVNIHVEDSSNSDD